MDVIKLDVPLFLRLLELAREEIENDLDLHDIAEIAAKLSKDTVLTMKHYSEITDFMQQQGSETTDAPEDDLDTIRRLGGIN